LRGAVGIEKNPTLDGFQAWAYRWSERLLLRAGGSDEPFVRRWYAVRFPMPKAISRTYVLTLLLVSTLGLAQTPELRTGNYLKLIRNSPPLLEAFLREMPKGGDLHNHLIGAVYAES